ncbi:hypothetical protein ANCDUO_07065 [Ancylostoma duodenale]|uniref:Peptidase aspartic putative domain-containing protein n=1 Tax=Ancylostoma duodenale TaxID=51022 RepID=A0A0C2GMV8_9BILA|nr:hypothetical protein ANCDUO_07065 [Ancylostoma duodenale]
MHTKSSLTSSMSTAKLSFADRRFIRKQKIRIAQPTLKTSVITPDILVGQDLIDTFLLRKEACITLPSGLVLTPTVFGYVTSGSSSVSMSRPSQTLTQNGAIIIATAVINTGKHKQHLKNLLDSKSSVTEIVKPKNKRSNPDFMNNDVSAVQMKNGKLLTGSPPFINNSSGVLTQTILKQPKSPNTDASSDASDKHSLGNDVKGNEGNVLQEIVAEFHQRKDVLNADAAILRDHLHDCPNNSITSLDWTSHNRLGQQGLLTKHSTEDKAVFNNPQMKHLVSDYHISDEDCETWMTITARTRLLKFRSEVRSQVKNARAPKASCRGNVLI